jgi:hypothetical protein
MESTPYDGLLLELETLSQKYALNKTSRRSLAIRLKKLPEELAALAVSETLHAAKRKAFNQGLAIGVALLPALYLLYKFIKLLGSASYWG